MSFQFFRRFFYEIHLWLGIVSGIVLFIVCLSGTLYVFREEAQHIAEPSRYYVDVPEGKAALSADELIAKVEAAKPGMKVASITIPEKANRTVSMNMASPNQGGGERGASGGPRNEGRQRGTRGEGRGERGESPERERGARPEGGRGERAGRRPENGTEAQRPGREGNQGFRGETAATGQGRPGAGPQGRSQGGPSQRGGGHGHGRNAVYVNPYTGEITGEGANVVDPFFTSMFSLHRWLWFSGEWRWVGKMIVGVATLVFVVICLTGLVLWLPRTWNSFKRWKAWKPGFRIRFRKGLWPFLYDTHNTVGFYLLIPALILALTGLCWSFSWYRTGAGYVLGTPVLQRGGQNTATIEPVDQSTSPLSVSEMIDRQNALTPGTGEIVVSIPQNREAPMTIQKGRTGFFALAIKDKTQWDRFRGTVIPVEHYGKTVKVERFADKPLGAQIAGSIRAIHFGNITGLSSKIFFFVVCLFATSWPATGIALWIKKLRIKRKKRNAEKKLVGQSGTIQAISHQRPSDETKTSVGQTV